MAEGGDGVKPILEEAHEIIYGEREQTYGNPGKNLQAIADYWNTYLYSKGVANFDLTYDDVCNMMVLLKVARLGNTPLHRDSMVDACGYLALADRVKESKNAKIIEAGTENEGGVQPSTGRPGKTRGAKPRTTARNRSRKSTRR